MKVVEAAMTAHGGAARGALLVLGAGKTAAAKGVVPAALQPKLKERGERRAPGVRRQGRRQARPARAPRVTRVRAAAEAAARKMAEEALA